MLKIKNLNLTLNNQQILNNVSLDLDYGKILSIIGPSGCGKTSILKSIAGTHKINSGKIILDGDDITEIPMNKRDVTLVFQDYSLFPHMTIKENMKVGSTDEVQNLTMLTKLKIDHLISKYPHEMSGGEQQRCSIARAITHKPTLLLLDEPFSNIDAITTKLFRTQVFELIKQFDITTIMVTHDLDDVFQMNSKCAVIENGYVTACDDIDKIYNSHRTAFINELFHDIHFIGGEMYKSLTQKL